MRRESNRYAILLLLLLYQGFLFSQEEGTKAIDSAMAFSPLYMPVSHDFIEPHFFKTLFYKDIDTNLSSTTIWDPLNSVDNLYQTLGILGQAHQSINYNYQKSAGFSMLRLPYPQYFKQQNDLEYYQLKTSYTRLNYTFGIPKENAFTATHAQKFSDHLNAVINMHGYTNSGYYLHQKIANFSIDALVHYEIPSAIYGFSISYIYNRFNFQENGGLQDPITFLTSNITDLIDCKVNSLNGITNINSHDLLFKHYVNLINKKQHYFGTITHSFQFNRLESSYFDYGFDSTFYRSHYYISPDTTADTLNYHHFINTLQWSNYSPFAQLSNQHYFIRLAGGIMHEYIESKSPIYKGNTITLFARTHIRLFKVLDLTGQFTYSFLGYNGNDATADFTAKIQINQKYRTFFGGNLNFYRVAPDFIYSVYSGNHNQWDTTWNKQSIVKAGAFWSFLDYRVSFNYFMLHNYVQLNAELRPFCYQKYISIIQLNLYAPVKIKDFEFNANLYLQYSNKDEIQVPLFAGKVSTFYTFHLFKRKTKLQIGFNMMYNTSYYANGYDPIMHQFYYQNNIRVGNYFYLDANINIRVQRIDIFARAGHVLCGLLGNHYFTTPYYSMTDRRFAIGINWRFYD